MYFSICCFHHISLNYKRPFVPNKCELDRTIVKTIDSTINITIYRTCSIGCVKVAKLIDENSKVL